MSNFLRPDRKSSRPRFVPLVEQMEDRRLLATWTVDDNFSGLGCNNNFRRCDTIQEAVDASRAGDIINVRGGTYDENVVVPKRLTIQATGNATVDPVDDGVLGVPANGFNLQANDIVIRGFRIGDFDASAGGAGADPDGSVGINTSSSFSGYRIRNNTIASNTFGIYLNTSTSNAAHQTVVSGNAIQNNNHPGAASGNGIYSDQGARNIRITGNRFFGNGNEDVIFVAPTPFDPTTLVATGSSPLQIDIAVRNNALLSSSGVFFVNVQRSQVSFNEIRNSNFNAIELAGGNVGITIRGNTLRNVGTQGFNGIYAYRRELVVGDFATNGPNTNNQIVTNTVINAGLTGIRIRNDSAFTIVRGNTVLGSKGFDLSDPAWGNGITLQGANHITVDSNVVKNNARHGIYVDADSSDNVIKSNVSLNNARVDPNGFDYNDDSTGDGTAGTDNTYRNNTGRTQNRPGLIRFHA
jgi:parallel beta-helix repeat protein